MNRPKTPVPVPHRLTTQFFDAIMGVVSEFGGAELKEQFIRARRTRERYIREQWQAEVEDSDTPLFRELDYDHLLMLLRSHLTESKQELIESHLALIKICCGIGEYRRAEELIVYLNATIDNDQVALRSEVHRQEGKLYYLMNKWDRSTEAYQRALRLFRQTGDVDGQFSANNNLGVLFQETWEVEQGKRHFREALHVIDQMGDEWPGVDKHRLFVQMNLAIIQAIQGKWEAAIEAFTRILQRREYLNAESYIGLLVNLAISYRDLSKYTQAENFIYEARELAQEEHNRRLTGLATLVLAEVKARSGQLDAAERELWEAFKIFSLLYDRIGVAETYRVFGLLAREQHMYEVARSQFLVSIDINKEYGNRLSLLEACYELSLLEKIQQNIEARLQYLQQALVYAESMNAGPRIAFLRQELEGES